MYTVWSEEHQAINELSSVRRRDVEALLGVGMSKAGRLLAQLVDTGALHRVGIGRSTRYVRWYP